VSHTDSGKYAQAAMKCLSDHWDEWIDQHPISLSWMKLHATCLKRLKSRLVKWLDSGFGNLENKQPPEPGASGYNEG
jgi:hypothetical protein